MILRRFTQHLSSQNWLAVGLDVCVVIVGIFLGMQVTDWNDSRKERLEERRYLTRLLDDANSSLAEMEPILEYQRSHKVEIQWALSTIEAGELTAENFPRLESLLLNLRGWRQLSYFTDTIEELISSGRLTLFQSEELRAQISRFRVEMDLYLKRAAVLGNAMIRRYEDIYVYVSLNAARDKVTTPIEDLADNQQFFDALNDLGAAHDGLIAFSEMFYGITKDFRDDLKSAQESTP